ncbi:MAG: hypothetical protein ACP5O7_12345 [Phycisphaerae bacterium]
MMLFPLPFFAAGASILYENLVKNPQNNPPRPSGPGWYALLPETNLRKRERIWLIVALALDGALLFIFWNYFSIASRPYGLLVDTITAICVLIALIPLVFLWREYRLRDLMEDGRLELRARKQITATVDVA